MRITTAERGTLVALVVVSALGLAGCAAASTSPGAGADTGAGGGAGAVSTSPSADAGAQQVRFAQCLREHGVQVADPDGNGMIRIDGGTTDRRTFEAAQKACKQFAPTGPVGPGGRTLDPDDLLPFTRCMREHGVDVPDPTRGEGGRVVLGRGAGFDPDDPAFASARKACERLLPGAGQVRS